MKITSKEIAYRGRRQVFATDAAGGKHEFVQRGEGAEHYTIDSFGLATYQNRIADVDLPCEIVEAFKEMRA